MPKKSTKPTALERARRILHGGVLREDSDDELGDEDLPWEWIYDSGAQDDEEAEEEVAPSTPSKKRKRGPAPKPRKKVARIIGARMGDRFECRIGDCLLIKGEGLAGEAYVGLATEFLEQDGEKQCNVMWFNTEFEIKNKKKKRMDFLSVSVPCQTARPLLTLSRMNCTSALRSTASLNHR